MSLLVYVNYFSFAAAAVQLLVSYFFLSLSVLVDSVQLLLLFCPEYLWYVAVFATRPCLCLVSLCFEVTSFALILRSRVLEVALALSYDALPPVLFSNFLSIASIYSAVYSVWEALRGLQ